MTDCDIPPEPVVTGDGVELVTLQERDIGEPQISGITLGSWICDRCGTNQTVPIIDGEFEEPDECTGCDRPVFSHKGGFSDEQLQAATRADAMWHPPTDLVESDKTELWQQVREFIYQHWGAEDTDLYDGLTAYALSTWFRPTLTFVPHLMVMGKTTGGKTRLLNTLSHVSYRAVVSASATPASLFRMIDAYNVSFFVSEYHGLVKESQQQLDNVVRAGQKEGEKVTRAEPTQTGFEPEVFDPFSHIGIATQYTPADDIVNRCIRIRTKPAQRDIPATIDAATGEAIRNKLLFHRFDLLRDSDKWEQAEQRAYGYLAQNNITGRTREKLLSLVTVAILWNHLDDIKPFVDLVVEQDEEATADSEDAQFTQVVKDLLFDKVNSNPGLGGDDIWAGIEIPHQEIKDEFYTHTGKDKSPTWVGQICSRLDIETTRKRDGTVIDDRRLRDKIERLCDEHNLSFEPSEVHNPVTELPESKQYEMTCSLCGEAKATHRLVVEGDYICERCADEEQQGVTG